MPTLIHSSLYVFISIMFSDSPKFDHVARNAWKIERACFTACQTLLNNSIYWHQKCFNHSPYLCIRLSPQQFPCFSRKWTFCFRSHHALCSWNDVARTHGTMGCGCSCRDWGWSNIHRNPWRWASGCGWTCCPVPGFHTRQWRHYGLPSHHCKIKRLRNNSSARKPAGILFSWPSRKILQQYVNRRVVVYNHTFHIMNLFPFLKF